MKKSYALIVFIYLNVLFSFQLQAQVSPLSSTTRGNLKEFVDKILTADNASLRKWTENPNLLDYSGFSPQQVEHLKSLVGNIATYKLSLNNSFGLGSSNSSRMESFVQLHPYNIPYEEGDEFYRSTMTNPGSASVPTFGFGGPPTSTNGVRDSLWTSDNYRGYLQAMLAKAGAANDVHAAMCFGGGYSQQDLDRILEYGIRAAEYVYQGTPTSYMANDQTAEYIMGGKNTIVASLRAKVGSKSNCRQNAEVKADESLKLMDWTEDFLYGSGKTIKIKNLSSKPVVVTHYTIYNCKNTAVAQCQAANIRRTILPGDTIELATVSFPFKDPFKGNSPVYMKGDFEYKYWAEFAK